MRVGYRDPLGLLPARRAWKRGLNSTCAHATMTLPARADDALLADPRRVLRGALLYPDKNYIRDEVPMVTTEARVARERALIEQIKNHEPIDALSTPSIRVRLRLGLEVHQRAQKLADQDDRSINYVLTRAILIGLLELER